MRRQGEPRNEPLAFSLGITLVLSASLMFQFVLYDDDSYAWLRRRRGGRSGAAALIVSVLVLVLGCARAWGQISGAESERSTADTQHRFAEIQASTGGHLGVAAVHVEDGRRVSFNGRRAFPMASVRKLPIAMTVLALVDEGSERLDRRIQVTADDLLAATGTPLELVPRAGKFLTIRQLLEVMLIYSDNTASATLQRAVANAALVQARLHTLGLDAVHVDRAPRDLMREFAQVRQLKGPRRADAMARLEADVRDSATPDAMADLLTLLQRGRGLLPASNELLLGIMRRCESGPRRLRAGLPAQVVLAHKTGTLARTTNDVGIATLPDGTHLAIAVFITGATQPLPLREDAIAAVARQVYRLYAGRNM